MLSDTLRVSLDRVRRKIGVIIRDEPMLRASECRGFGSKGAVASRCPRGASKSPGLIWNRDGHWQRVRRLALVRYSSRRLKMSERTTLTVVAGRGESGTEVVEAQRYLARYGYLSDEERAATDEGQLTAPTSVALRRFQRFARLRVTGTLTIETLKLMRQPRCPVADLEPEELGGPGSRTVTPPCLPGTPGTTATCAGSCNRNPRPDRRGRHHPARLQHLGRAGAARPSRRSVPCHCRFRGGLDDR